MKKKIEWSKLLTAWVLILNTYVVYHGVKLCYVSIESGTSASLGWLATLITVVVGLGNVVITAYMGKSAKENTEKIKSSTENYP